MTFGSHELRSQASVWYGDVPTDWNVEKFKRIATIRNGQVDPEDERYKDLPLFAPNHIESGTGRLLGVESADAQGAESGKYLVEAGEVVYSKIRPALRKLIVAPFKGLCSADMYPVQPTSRVDARFLFYAMLGEGFSKYTLLESDRVAMPKINREALGECVFVYPQRDQQVRIATFLDRKTAAIDALVAKKERLIDLIDEKRQALITQAVTKGLDPNVAMKESGVAWLGRIPARWAVQELRHRISRIEQGWSPSCESREADDGEWGVLKVGCVNYGGFRDTENKALPRDLEPVPELEVHVGDVLVSRANTRELVGSAAYVEHTRSRLLLCDKLFRIHYRASQTDARFLVLLLQSDLCRFQFEREATGASDSMQNIGQDSVRRLLFGWAPLDEQRTIVTHVAARTAQIDALKRRLLSHIGKLREYRQALITAAVTGKIDATQREAA